MQHEALAGHYSGFREVPASARLAIMVPTLRWNSMTRSVLGALLGVANEEVVVLVADNSENSEKWLFLQKIQDINPYVIAIAHERNIGALDNFFYLFNWTKNIPFIAQMADDDWISPTYHFDAYKTLLDHPGASCAEAGTAFADIGGGQLMNISQRSMCGNNAIERIVQWDCRAARITMYNVSRRETLRCAVEFFRTTPLNGLTLVENLYELNRLALGDFIHAAGLGCFVHYPAMASLSGNQTQRSYDTFFKAAGLQYPFVFFAGLSTAVQCALFLMGRLSPIADAEQRRTCGQQAFVHIYTTSFLPNVATREGHEAAGILFAKHPDVLYNFSKYCNPPYTLNPVMDRALLDWFIALVAVFENKTPPDGQLLSVRFAKFSDDILVGLM